VAHAPPKIVAQPLFWHTKGSMSVSFLFELPPTHHQLKFNNTDHIPFFIQTGLCYQAVRSITLGIEIRNLGTPSEFPFSASQIPIGSNTLDTLPLSFDSSHHPDTMKLQSTKSVTSLFGSSSGKKTNKAEVSLQHNFLPQNKSVVPQSSIPNGHCDYGMVPRSMEAKFDKGIYIRCLPLRKQIRVLATHLTHDEVLNFKRGTRLDIPNVYHANIKLMNTPGSHFIPIYYYIDVEQIISQDANARVTFVDMITYEE
jgi:hypothetical protein